MSNKKVCIIEGKDEYELAEKINNSKLDIFATTPIQKNNSSWIAFVYYNHSGGKSNAFSTSVKKDFTPHYEPTEKQLSHWNTIKPTEKTKDLLLKKGFTRLEINQIKTQLDAYTLLEKLK
jgi:hypothetical protein